MTSTSTNEERRSMDSLAELDTPATTPSDDSSSSKISAPGQSKGSGRSNSHKPSDRVSTVLKSSVKVGAKGVGKISKKAGKISKQAGHFSKRAAINVKKKSKTAYEKNTLCAPLRWLFADIPRHWPRTSAILFGVLLPLWILILIATAFGALLASFESGEELIRNDSILQAKAEMEYFQVDTETLLDLPYYCLGQFFREQNETSLTTLFDATTLASTFQECSAGVAPTVELALQVEANNSDLATEPLAFHWNRCWNETTQEYAEQFSFIFYPTMEIIEASRPKQQALTYTQAWQASQEVFYQQFLDGNESPTPEEEREAFRQSIAVATGEETCQRNIGGTAWFFFTVMTTVGYGNQAPVTPEGRMLIFTAGLFSLILFGAVLGTSGYILLAIVDDLTRRIPWLGPQKWFHHPLFGALMWFIIWFSWLIIIGVDADLWWQNRLPEYHVETPRDTMWFAFISTSTIGLGDYYLQPEVMFASDTLKFSITFLTGFVFLSTFFGKIVEWVGTVLPNRENSLETRLKKTRLLLCWKNGRCLLFAPDRHQSEYQQQEDEDEEMEREEREQQDEEGDDEIIESDEEDPNDQEGDTLTGDESSSMLRADHFGTDEQRLQGLKAILESMQEETYSGIPWQTNSGSTGDDRSRTLEVFLQEETILKDLMEKVRTRRYQLERGSSHVRTIQPVESIMEFHESYERGSEDERSQN